MRATSAGLKLFQGICLALTLAAIQSCSSAKKQRFEEREKLSATTGFYCNFINGDQYQDFEVVLNLDMAKRCDPTKPFSISDYKSAADIHGLLYCCSTVKKETKNANKSVGKPASSAKADDAKGDDHKDAAADKTPGAANKAAGGDKPAAANKAAEGKAPEKANKPAEEPEMEQTPKANNNPPAEDTELDQ